VCASLAEGGGRSYKRAGHPREDGEGWSSGADGGTPPVPERVAAVVRDGKGELDNLGAARLPKQ